MDIGLWEVKAKRPLNKVNKWQKSINKTFFSPWIFYTIFQQKMLKSETISFHYFPHGFWIFKKFGHWTSGNGIEKAVKRSEQMKKICKNLFCCGNFTTFWSNKVQIWDQLFLFLFPKNLVYLKSLDIWFWEVGAKRLLNGVNKVWRTDKHTKQKPNKKRQNPL